MAATPIRIELEQLAGHVLSIAPPHGVSDVVPHGPGDAEATLARTMMVVRRLERLLEDLRAQQAAAATPAETSRYLRDQLKTGARLLEALDLQAGRLHALLDQLAVRERRLLAICDRIDRSIAAADPRNQPDARS